MRHKTPQTSLDYGSLESRKLLAGGVYASLSGENLTVIGDYQDNSFSINLNATTAENLVQGQDGTQVRYANALLSGFDSIDIFNIYVYSNSGNDTVSIDGRSPTAKGELVVSLGYGDDSLYVKGGEFGNNVTVYAGANHDSVSFDETQVSGNLALIAGAGMDAFALNAVDIVGETRFFGQFGHDTMLVNDSSFGQNAYIELGDGADRYESVGSQYAGRISVRGRLGFDTAMLESTNSFASIPNIQTIEIESETPNHDGAVDASIDQISDSFLNVGSELRVYSADGIQDGMSELAAAFNTSLFKLNLDEATQTVSIRDPTQSISAIWDQVVQDAVIVASPGPTIGSRAFAMMHTAMYDAWSAYDEVAIATTLEESIQRPAIENTDQNKQVAMSFAAFHVLEDLFTDQASTFENVMQQLGFDPTNPSTDLTTPAGIGNHMAQQLLEIRHADGSNQLGDDPSGTLGVAYSDISGYTPSNPVGDPNDIAVWTPEYVPIDSTPGTEDRIQEFLTPHWGGVDSFALNSGDEFRPVEPEPFLLVDGEVDLDAKTITLSDDTVVNIDSSIVGTIINPVFISQAEEVVEFSANLTDEQKIVAEFWEDGGGTSFPPGTFMTFGQFVSARDNHTLDDDAQMFFALGNAVFDAGVATWESKTNYDYVRPVRAIRDLGELGLIGQFNADLGGYAIEAWTPSGETQTILATEFLTYQTPGEDSSPPFSEYTSGHSAFSAAGATILELFTGSDQLDASVTFEAGSSRFEPGATPSEDLTLSWDTFTAAADEAGLSRLYGGIHFIDGDLNGRVLGDSVGEAVWSRTQFFINGGPI